MNQNLDTNTVQLTVNGRTMNLAVDEIQVASDDIVTIRYKVIGTDGKHATAEEKPTEADRPRIRSYMTCSALVRFYHGGSIGTAAITHCTDRAVRLFNLEYGAAWIPKSAVRWSDAAQMFCIVDDTVPLFTKEVTEAMNEYPPFFNPQTIHEQEGI